MTNELPNAAAPAINTDLKLVLEKLKLPISVNSVLDLRTVCGMDLQTAKVVFPGAKTIAITSQKNQEKLSSHFDDVLTINIEKDCLPFPSKTIDIVLADNVFNQAKEIIWVIHEITRSLRIAGYLIIKLSENVTDQYTFKTAEEINDFLNTGYKNGYEVVPIVANQFPFLPAWLARFAKKMSKAKNTYLVLQKTQPYLTGYLDCKIQRDHQS